MVLGGGLGNTAYPTKNVIDLGGNGNSYKLIWISQEIAGSVGGRNVVYLDVKEYHESPAKPFTMIVNSKTLSGLCN